VEEPNTTTGDATGTETQGGATSTGSPNLHPDVGYSHANILFQTKFVNNTKDPQEYTMRTEKTTRSSCSTSIETTFTNLKTPCEVFEASAGYSREQSLTNSDGETLEEELTWGVESLIKVKAEHVAEAQLVVDEKKYAGDFVIETTI